MAWDEWFDENRTDPDLSQSGQLDVCAIAVQDHSYGEAPSNPLLAMTGVSGLRDSETEECAGSIGFPDLSGALNYVNDLGGAADTPVFPGRSGTKTYVLDYTTDVEFWQLHLARSIRLCSKWYRRIVFQ